VPPLLGVESSSSPLQASGSALAANATSQNDITPPDDQRLAPLASMFMPTDVQRWRVGKLWSVFPCVSACSSDPRASAARTR